MTFRELRERKFEKLTDFAIALKENISTVSVEEVVACFTEKKEEG